MFAALVALCLAAGAPASANGLDSLAEEVSQGARRAGVGAVAVIPFAPADGSSPQAGWRIAENLATALVRRGRVHAVERSLLAAVLAERRRSASRQGLLAANGVLTGVFQAQNGGTAVHAELISAATGGIIAAWDARLPGAPQRSSERALAALDLAEPYADASCAEVQARVDRLEGLMLDLKARFWAARLRRGGTLQEGLVFPGSTITSPELKQALYDRMNDWFAKDPPPLTRQEEALLAALDQKALALYRRCSPRDPRPA